MRNSISLDEYFAAMRDEKSPLHEEALRSMMQNARPEKGAGLYAYGIAVVAIAAFIIFAIVFVFYPSKNIKLVSTARTPEKASDTPVKKAIAKSVEPVATTFINNTYTPSLRINNYQYSSPENILAKDITGVHLLSLAPEELEKLGITVSDENICISALKKCISAAGEMKYENTTEDKKPSPVLITDDGGKIVSKQNNDNKLPSGNTLVPVLVCSYDSQSKTSILNHDIICWYNPDDTLFKNLPLRYSEDMRKDVLQLSGKSADNTNCEYFEICKNTLASFGDMRLFPNPVQNSFTLEVRIKCESRVHMGIYDINGNEVMTLATNYTLKEGLNSLHYETECLAKGIYLLEIISEYGETAYQRMIKL